MLLWLGATLLLLQFVQIKVPPPPKAKPSDEIKAPKEVMAILKRSCYDCHSNHTKWPWYSKVSPISLQVNSNVRNGRRALNFSIWNQYSKEKKQKLYQKMVDALRIKMPPVEYMLVHKEARLTPKERKMLQDWAQKELEKLENN